MRQVIGFVANVSNRTDGEIYYSEFSFDEKTFEFLEPLALMPSQRKQVLLDYTDFSAHELIPGKFYVHDNGVRCRVLTVMQTLEFICNNFLTDTIKTSMQRPTEQIKCKPGLMALLGDTMRLERYRRLEVNGVKIRDAYDIQGPIYYSFDQEAEAATL